MQLYSFTGSGYACLKKSVSRMLGQWNCDRNDVVVGAAAMRQSPLMLLCLHQLSTRQSQPSIISSSSSWWLL